ncbi:MAG TPA: PQQ-binding-like beta-propeller repeat protein [Candidatus Baltobacteraceae bacterium]|nr:PQQ-binding-like beta-propeller repeat protein [Candidatus Baltobacteraceae bacterium]
MTSRFAFISPALFAFVLAAAVTGCSGGSAQNGAGVIPTSSGVPNSQQQSSQAQSAPVAMPLTAEDLLDASATPNPNWTEFGKTSAHAGFNSAETTLSRTNVGGLTQLWGYATGGQIESSVLVNNGVAYVDSSSGYLYALNASTGSLIWEYQTYEGGSPQDMPAIDGPRIIVPCLIGGNSQENAMCAINTSTGKRVWAYYVDCNCLPPAGVGSAPVASGNYVAFIYANGSTDSDYLLVANSTNGTAIWGTTLAHGPSYSTAAISGTNIYYDPDGKSVCSAVLASGTENWCLSTGSDSVPAVSGGVVYANTTSNGLYAINASTGAELWQYTPTAGNGGGYYNPAAIADGRVYISGIGSGGNLYALNAKTGAVDFITATASSVNTDSSPSIANGVVYVSCQSDLCAFNSFTGKQLYAGTSGAGTSYVSPSIVNGVVYTACGANNLCVFSLPSSSTRAK